MKNILYVLLLFVLLCARGAAQPKADVLSVYNDSAVTAEGRKDYDTALKYYSKINKALYAYTDNNEYTKYYPRCIMKEALCLEQLKRYDEAFTIYDNLLRKDISAENKKDVSNRYVRCAVKIAEVWSSLEVQRFDEARALLNQVRHLADESTTIMIGETYGLAWYAQSIIEEAKLDYASSFNSVDSAIVAFEKIGKHSYTPRLQMDKGNIYLRLYEILPALEIYNEVCSEARTNNNEKLLYDALSKSAEAYGMINDMKKYMHTVNALDSLVAATNNDEIRCDYYIKAGDLLVKKGNYTSASVFYQKYMDVVNMMDDNQWLDKAAAYYGKMRDMYFKMKDFKNAEIYGVRSAECFAKQYPKDHYAHYLPYLVLANIYSEQNDSVNFEHCCDSMRVAMNYGIDTPTQKAVICMMEGMGYAQLNNYGKALNCFLASDSLVAKNNYYDATLNDMTVAYEALCLGKLGRNDEARSMIERYRNITRENYGIYSEEYANALNRCASVESINGDTEASCATYSESANILKEIIKKQLRYVTTSERHAYLGKITNKMWDMSEHAHRSGCVNNKFTEDCYNALLFSKSLLLHSDRSLLESMKDEGCEEDFNDMTRLSALRLKLKNISNDANCDVDSIISQIRMLDDRLTIKSSEFSNYTNFLDIEYEDIKKALKKNDILIDFVDYEDSEEGHVYMAYVIRKGNKYPLLKRIFSEEKVDSLIYNENADYIYKPGNADYLLQKLFDVKNITDCSKGTIYYIPSGSLFGVSLESLSLADGSLLTEHYDVVRLSSAREVINHDKHLKCYKTAAVYGGLNYDVDEKVMLVNSRRYNKKFDFVFRKTDNNNKPFEYLPQSKTETEDICNTLSDNGYKVTLFCGDNGTEESFLNLHLKSPQIIHLATHGYYLKTDYEENDISADAMSLSGIIFSGANAAWTGKDVPENVMSGVLSAADISCLDLSDTDLAVLSACKTGRGGVTNEGLYGLQRAFKKAGVNTVVMTLWNVSDVVTKEFMTSFYDNLFKTKYNKRKAFEQARRLIRSRYPEPQYWAGFVMVD